MFCACHFCSQVFKTTSNFLNFDVNIVNIALNAFCSLKMTKLAPGRCRVYLGPFVWVASRKFAAVVVCFSFALIEFSSKRFLSFFDCFMPPGVV